MSVPCLTCVCVCRNKVDVMEGVGVMERGEGGEERRGEGGKKGRGRKEGIKRTRVEGGGAREGGSRQAGRQAGWLGEHFLAELLCILSQATFSCSGHNLRSSVLNELPSILDKAPTRSLCSGTAPAGNWCKANLQALPSGPQVFSKWRESGLKRQISWKVEDCEGCR